jgi:hypothetical protein
LDNKQNRWIIKFIAIIIAVVFLLSGCAQLSSPIQPSSSKTKQSNMSQPPILSPTQPSPSLSPTTLSPQPPSPPNTTVQPTMPASSTPGATTADIYSNFEMSKAPAVGEVVDLSCEVQWVYTPNKSVNKVWLEFERYDPALYYPLGQGQFYIDIHLGWLAKASPDSGTYFFLSQAVKDQPESIVPEKSIVVSGNTSWEGVSKQGVNRANLSSRISFPEEGEWVIDVMVQYDDGSSKVQYMRYLTVNKDSGTMSWPYYYKGPGGITPANPGSPVGVYARVGHAPSPGEEFPILTTVYSIEDLDQASASVHFVRMDGYKYIDVPFSDIAVKGEDKWEGSLKKGVPAQFSCAVKFPDDGEWVIVFHTQASPNSQDQQIGNLYLHIEKEKSCFGWLMDHNNPAVDKHWQDQLEKALHSNTIQSDGNTQKKTPDLDVYIQTMDSEFTITGQIQY